MNYYKAKRKWFKRNVATFTIYFYWAGWSYEIVQYEVIPEKISINNISFRKKGILHFPRKHSYTQEFPNEVAIMQQYFKGFEPCELFFEARSLSGKNLHNANSLGVTYKTFMEFKETILDITFGEAEPED